MKKVDYSGWENYQRIFLEMDAIKFRFKSITDKTEPKSNIVKFYTGGTDCRGRTIESIITSPDNWWEIGHDFIQWVFPTKTRSQFNLDAPILTETDIKVLQGNRVCQSYFILVLNRWFDFLLIDWNGSKGFRPMTLDGQIPHWIRPNNHNFLRITRMMETCNLLMSYFDNIVMDFYHFLKRTYGTNKNISDKTWKFWETQYHIHMDAYENQKSLGFSNKWTERD